MNSLKKRPINISLIITTIIILLLTTTHLIKNQTTPAPNPTCAKQLTPNQTEGPYYKPGSPQTNNLRQNNPGEKIILTGYVYDKNCNPVPHAWLDFWQADTNGNYDNTNFNLRGHQFTEANGKYQLETILPGAYELRPPHIHIKIRPPKGETLTTQLYFSNTPQNQLDPIFNSSLVVTQAPNTPKATFNFTLNQ